MSSAVRAPATRWKAALRGAKIWPVSAGEDEGGGVESEGTYCGVGRLGEGLRQIGRVQRTKKGSQVARVGVAGGRLEPQGGY